MILSVRVCVFCRLDRLDRHTYRANRAKGVVLHHNADRLKTVSETLPFSVRLNRAYLVCV